MFLDQEFQTQLVDIDKERTKFYGKDKEGEESAAERPCTTNSWVLESAIYLKNLFAQTNLKRQPPLNKKFTRVVRKISGVEGSPERREQVLAKRARQDFEEDSDDANRCLKKRVLTMMGSMVATDDQPCRQ